MTDRLLEAARRRRKLVKVDRDEVISGLRYHFMWDREFIERADRAGLLGGLKTGSPEER